MFADGPVSVGYDSSGFLESSRFFNQNLGPGQAWRREMRRHTFSLAWNLGDWKVTWRLTCSHVVTLCMSMTQGPLPAWRLQGNSHSGLKGKGFLWNIICGGGLGGDLGVYPSSGGWMNKRGQKSTSEEVCAKWAKWHAKQILWSDNLYGD